ncbi:hypothetical protein [uncultured Paraglaciecola sp.]|uniref:HvfA family oxazolone/thioamide-modified RiPP metallophore n=1 Tax=uncultured Paraglaciecola sp. TaxID=1765024 RepID=UPI002630FFCB|nr:hypothetical protein [uncultured Paraglaciecola sp.]
MQQINKTTIATALGAVVIGSLASVSAQASTNPFSVHSLESGYMQDVTEGKCGEGKCGEDKAKKTAKAMKEGKCGEGKCGEGKCGGDKAKKAAKAMKEGKCGEGKCGEGKCGGDKAKKTADASK